MKSTETLEEYIKKGKITSKTLDYVKISKSQIEKKYNLFKKEYELKVKKNRFFKKEKNIYIKQYRLGFNKGKIK